MDCKKDECIERRAIDCRPLLYASFAVLPSLRDDSPSYQMRNGDVVHCLDARQLALIAISAGACAPPSRRCGEMRCYCLLGTISSSCDLRALVTARSIRPRPLLLQSPLGEYSNALGVSVPPCRRLSFLHPFACRRPPLIVLSGRRPLVMVLIGCIALGCV